MFSVISATLYSDNLLVQQCDKKVASNPTAEKKASNNLQQQQCALATKMTTTARLLEHLLFQDASSLEMYCEMSTLKDRLKGISIKLLRRRLQKRQKMIIGDRSIASEFV
jgi:hypothetical protein